MSQTPLKPHHPPAAVTEPTNPRAVDLDAACHPYENFRWVAVSMVTSEPLAGDDDYQTLLERLQMERGDDYYLGVTIIGPRKIA